MEALKHDERTLTELDHVRLERLLASPIDGILDAADLVSSQEVPADVVTMYSQVELADPATGSRQRLTLCYPTDANPSSGSVSVLSPVGASLIGRRVGSIARWRTPDGAEGAAQIVALLFQPEASGNFTR
jgi:regulator of nucleoside diphosphate kinase